MPRDRSALGSPLGADGPWLAAILSVLDEIADMLTHRPAGGDVSQYEMGPNEILIGTSGSVEAPPAKDDEADKTDEATQTAAPVKVSEPAPDRPPLPEPPPRAGRGASAELWQTWAENAGLTIPDGATRNDIIAACEKAGILNVSR